MHKTTIHTLLGTKTYPDLSYYMFNHSVCPHIMSKSFSLLQHRHSLNLICCRTKLCLLTFPYTTERPRSLIVPWRSSTLSLGWQSQQFCLLDFWPMQCCGSSTNHIAIGTTAVCCIWFYIGEIITYFISSVFPSFGPVFFNLPIFFGRETDRDGQTKTEREREE